MATVAQLNFVKSLLKRHKMDPEDYILTESVSHKAISGLIDQLKNGEVITSEEWQEILEEKPVVVSSTDYDKNCFEPEIQAINSLFIKSFVRAMLDRAPNYFFSVPASSSSKYHPDFAGGHGGLIRHTKAAIIVALSFFENPVLCNLNRDEKDIILAAIILHDSCKHGLEDSSHTVHEHPLLVKELYSPSMLPGMLPEQQELLDKIFSCISSPY